jgi:Ca2+-binding EF-hand superfamily protein
MPTYEEQMQGAKRSFALYDLNHDGVISRKEWSTLEARAAASIPAGKSRAQYTCALDQQFKLIDSNHDGKITFAEMIADNFGKNRPAMRGCY